MDSYTQQQKASIFERAIIVFTIISDSNITFKLCIKFLASGSTDYSVSSLQISSTSPSSDAELMSGVHVMICEKGGLPN